MTTPKLNLREKIKGQRLYFSKKILGVNFKEHQEIAALKMLNGSKVAIRSAHDLGKTFTIATIALEALYAMGPAYIIVTAPTWNQIKNIFFKELAERYANAKYPLGGKLNTTELDCSTSKNKKWQLIGFSPKRSATGDNSAFQGFHNELVIVIFEEATGIQSALYDATEGMMTSANVKWWAIGNPTDENSRFASLFKSADWDKIVWPCFLSSNLKANDVNTIEDIRNEANTLLNLDDDDRLMRLNSYKIVDPQLLTLKWVMARYLDWGEESTLFQSKVLAEFPTGSEDALIGLGRVEECMSLDSIEEGKIVRLLQGRKAIGVDVARKGNDNTVIKVLDGNEEIYSITLSKADTVQTYREIKKLCEKWPTDEISIAVDATGIGAGVIDNLNNDYFIAANKNITVHEVNFGGKAIDEKLYVNCATEMALLLTNRMKAPEGMLLKEDSILTAQITSRRFKHDRDGRFWLEDKDTYKKRMGGKSCDELDSLMLANYADVLMGRNSVFSIEDLYAESSSSISSQLGEY